MLAKRAGASLSGRARPYVGWERIAPGQLTRLAVCPLNAGDAGTGKARWRHSLGYAWWHAEVGAELAEAAGLSERAALYIRTHHQPNGPAAELHSVDEVS